MTPLELADACEKATGPDRELDAEIAAAMNVEHGAREIVHYESRSVTYIDECAPAYTASLDAAMTLVPDGTGHDPFWMLKAANPNNPKGCRAEIWVKDRPKPFRGRAATPALALCAASLRAIDNGEQKDG